MELNLEMLKSMNRQEKIEFLDFKINESKTAINLMKIHSEQIKVSNDLPLPYMKNIVLEKVNNKIYKFEEYIIIFEQIKTILEELF